MTSRVSLVQSQYSELQIRWTFSVEDLEEVLKRDVTDEEFLAVANTLKESLPYISLARVAWNEYQKSLRQSSSEDTEKSFEAET